MKIWFITKHLLRIYEKKSRSLKPDLSIFCLLSFPSLCTNNAKAYLKLLIIQLTWHMAGVVWFWKVLLVVIQLKTRWAEQRAWCHWGLWSWTPCWHSSWAFSDFIIWIMTSWYFSKKTILECNHNFTYSVIRICIKLTEIRVPSAYLFFFELWNKSLGILKCSKIPPPRTFY